MKHIKIAFVLLAAIFVSLSSFNNKTAQVTVGQWFAFQGSPGVDEYNPQAYALEAEIMECDGSVANLCSIQVEADNIDGQHPDQTALSALLAEAATLNEEEFTGSLTYSNGKVRVIP